MYDFHCNYIEQKYGKKYNYYSQTDSLTYEIKTEDFWNDKGKFDQ